MRSNPVCAADDYFEGDFMGRSEEIFLDTIAGLERIASTLGLATSTPFQLTAPVTADHRLRTKVPAIKLPQFSGSYTEWIEFRDHFTAVIINDDSFDGFQKLYYLKSCLTGEAATVLKNLSINAENFAFAWQLLTNRYENQRRLLRVHLQRLFTIKPVTKDNSPSELRRLLDSTQESLDALSKMDRPVSDDISTFLIEQRLDSGTREAWEFTLEGEEYGTLAQITKFLTSKIRSLEAATGFTKNTKVEVASTQPRLKSASASRMQVLHANVSSFSNANCKLCNATHPLFRCSKFIELSISQRWDHVKQSNLCLNCLSSRHTTKWCKSEKTCMYCNKRHHSLLHDTSKPERTNVPSESRALGSTSHVDADLAQTHLSNPSTNPHVLLATAWVIVTAASQRTVKLRALIDPGSTRTYITQEVVNLLQTRAHDANIRVTGIGQMSTEKVTKVVPISVMPVNCDYVRLSSTALVIDSLTSYTPKFKFPLTHWPHLQNLDFADGNPTDDTKIHALIGADVYPYALRDGIRRGKCHEPVAVNTVFGWILLGRGDTDDASLPDSPRFWEIEDIKLTATVTDEDEHCEHHFASTHSRTPSGQYVVRIPLKDTTRVAIGDTRNCALQCLYSMELRLASRPVEREAYTNFMREYEALGHMRHAPACSLNAPVVYLPHHAVIKDTSVTTKTRVVFNASAASDNGQSLNDLQFTGPKLQTELPTIHMQWRTHKFVYAADIAKMYRQILVDERDVDLQRILWRSSPSDQISEFQLLTVTYGTASAPYLALRVLRQLCEDEGSRFPHAKEILLNNFFVDDALFGADTVEGARSIRDEVIAMLATANFRLRKWVSNSTELLFDLDETDHGLSCDKTLQDDHSIKILGVSWHPASDAYSFYLNLDTQSVWTKRVVLSHIARIFDPLGWIAPVVIVAKIFMQSLWQHAPDWDSPLTPELTQTWLKFYEHLPSLSQVTIPRWIRWSPRTRMEVHGFCDASPKAYDAVVYTRCTDAQGHSHVSLLVSKTRVAPIKTVSIPRLELCGAMLLASLIDQVRSNSTFANSQLYCWTDATIVIAWLQGCPSQWKTFVANRVAEVQSLLPDVSWRHVSSAENPADLATRGSSAHEIAKSRQWWHGPSWLQCDESNWPTLAPPLAPDAPLESRSQTFHATISNDTTTSAINIFNRFSSWPHMCRVMHRMLLWSRKWRKAHEESNHSYLQMLNDVQSRIFAVLQAEAFPEELKTLAGNQPSPDGSRYLAIGRKFERTSRLRRLNPFLDTTGLLRVGGRLSLARLSLSAKHPVILPSGHVAGMLIRHAHLRCLHGSIALTLSTVRDRVWILQAP